MQELLQMTAIDAIRYKFVYGESVKNAHEPAPLSTSTTKRIKTSHCSGKAAQEELLSQFRQLCPFNTEAARTTSFSSYRVCFRAATKIEELSEVRVGIPCNKRCGTQGNQF